MRRINSSRLLLLVVLAAVGMSQIAFGQSSSDTSSSVPALTQFVTDQAGVLTSDQIATLNARLRTYQDTTSTQIVVLIVNSVPGGDLFDYSMSVAEKNKIGQKGKDNGLLFAVDVGDHKTRIQVGYGLEGVVTDAYSSYILNEIVIPEFKQNDYYDGINKGVTALAALIGGTFHANLKKEHGGGGNPIPFLVIFAVMFLIPMLFSNRRYSASSRGASSGWWFFPPFGGFGGGGFGGGGFGGFGGGGGGGFGGFSGGGGGFGGGGAGGSW